MRIRHRIRLEKVIVREYLLTDDEYRELQKRQQVESGELRTASNWLECCCERVGEDRSYKIEHTGREETHPTHGAEEWE